METPTTQGRNGSSSEPAGGESPRLVYLDCSATTPVAPEVLEAMLPFFTERFANASGAYAMGRQARVALETARSRMAGLLGCAPSELVITSGGSESDNLALRGAAHALREAGRGQHLITSPIEHEAILATCHQLADMEGFALTVLPVDAQGRVDPVDVLAALRPDTSLVSIMMANNEVGTLQPIAEIGAELRARGIVFHTDAVQAGAWCDLDVERLGVDLMSLSAHKFYGPKGVGLLYVRSGTPIHCVQTGGGHEQGLRSGTENVAGAVGMSLALELAQSQREAVCARAAGLRDRLIEALLALPGLQLTGHPTDRIPGHASFCVEGAPADALLLGMDMHGICASSGSACSAGKLHASHVLTAMGVPEALAHGALRFSLGRYTSQADIDYTVEVLRPLIERLRRLSVLAAEATTV
ncbi:MAG: cysteine desulfurase [Caldilineae bacterium]|nr:cysteine desulfurase [Chloroflexota bacterium]MCB9176487.1 cysteine desulfurase [Caldilineae bacterium]